jgi:hypothetical protein
LPLNILNGLVTADPVLGEGGQPPSEGANIATQRSTCQRMAGILTRGTVRRRRRSRAAGPHRAAAEVLRGGGDGYRELSANRPASATRLPDFRSDLQPPAYSLLLKPPASHARFPGVRSDLQPAAARSGLTAFPVVDRGDHGRVRFRADASVAVRSEGGRFDRVAQGEGGDRPEG